MPSGIVRWVDLPEPPGPVRPERTLATSVCTGPGRWRPGGNTNSEADFASLGSIGHPEHCAWACRFMKRPQGCHHKAACPRCHLCTWSKATLKMEAAAKLLQPMPLLPIACIPATALAYAVPGEAAEGRAPLENTETPDTDEELVTGGDDL
ncbi:unnamed protein product [Durusdinium trenchii]|uniref:Uncharacterized protein n=1 Tax=Durusdinium trenchii TaxID=1381693 RepID=A0ABP0I6D2_9DINO